MSTHKIIITESDRRRLTHLLTSDLTAAIQSKSYLTDLRTELQRAEIVDAADVPADVITMNSTVSLRDLDTGELETYTLVFPHEANIANSKLSILAPIGTPSSVTELAMSWSGASLTAVDTCGSKKFSTSRREKLPCNRERETNSQSPRSDAEWG